MTTIIPRIIYALSIQDASDRFGDGEWGNGHGGGGSETSEDRMGPVVWDYLHHEYMNWGKDSSRIW